MLVRPAERETERAINLEMRGKNYCINCLIVPGYRSDLYKQENQVVLYV